MSLGNAADRRVARHLGDQVDIQSEQRGLQAHASSGHRSLASGMPGAHHNHLEMFVKRLHSQ